MADEGLSLERQNEIVKFFCRHLVALSGTYEHLNDRGQPSGQHRFFHYSGFVMSFRGHWVFVTAGHALEDFEMKRPKVHVSEVVLTDIFGTDAVSNIPIPLAYDDAVKYHEFDMAEGLDFGMILLGEHERRLLKANGIIAVAEENWARQGAVAFSMYSILGIPENVPLPDSTINVEEKVAAKQQGMVQPILLSVQEIDQPDNVDRPTYPWFVAKISENAKIESVVGMSGGPILGFAKDSEGRLRYWVVALQSWWDKDRRIVFGCRVPFFAEMICNGFDMAARAFRETYTQSSQNRKENAEED